jgi:Domain of unknown function (DU1801)
MTPQAQLDVFLDRFTPDIAKLARAAIARMKKRLPGSQLLVYDNFNALAIGFGPSERAGEALFSLAIYARWINLFFLDGARMKDPKKKLKGAGSKVRHVRLTEVALIDDPDISALMDQALARAEIPIDPKQKSRVVIRAIAPKQRPRRP